MQDPISRYATRLPLHWQEFLGCRESPTIGNRFPDPEQLLLLISYYTILPLLQVLMESILYFFFIAMEIAMVELTLLKLCLMNRHHLRRQALTNRFVHHK